MVSHVSWILAHTQDAPKRSLAIAKELGVLSTNIPTAWDSSIFLRVDDDRVDCIKAMIIGPKDTPYENGCFLFDIFLPLEYNYRCPSVQFMTTNGGKYRYNPNLYADGVSLLRRAGTDSTESLPESPRYLAGTWMDFGQVDAAPGPHLDPEPYSVRGAVPQ